MPSKMTSDGGAMLLREADRLHDVTRRLAACFVDHRDPRRAEHPVAGLIAQRVMALALGYEDLNDHDRLRSDPALALASGCDDLAGNRRVRTRDRGHALAASSTLNRQPVSTGDRHRTLQASIVADPGMIEERLMVSSCSSRCMRRVHPRRSFSTWTPPMTRSMAGRRAGGARLLSLPAAIFALYIFCGYEDINDHVLPSSTADRDASDGALDELGRIVLADPHRLAGYPDHRSAADSGFCRRGDHGLVRGSRVLTTCSV